MKKLLLLFALFFADTTLAQMGNLVKNGGLEQYWRCPRKIDEIKFTYYWTPIDTVNYPYYYDTFGSPLCTPEYCNRCASLSEASVPQAFRYNHDTHGGDGMAQVMMYTSDTTSEYERDYLQGQLTTAIDGGRRYCVTFFAVLEHGSAFAINNIGAYLDDGTIDSSGMYTCGKPHPYISPQAFETAVISDTLSWTMIQGEFTANGNEKYITIGNFFRAAATTAIPTHSWRAAQLSNGVASFYLIDDVSVIASDAVAYAGHDTAILTGDTATIGVTTNGDGMPCWWYPLGGTAAIDSGGTIKVHPATTTSYVVKMNLCGNITYDTVKVSVVPAGVASPRSAPREWKVWPNPAGDELNVSGAKDCVVELVDVVGRIVITSPPTTEKTLIDVSKLPPGTYFVKVTEPVTGGCVTKRLVKD